MTTTAQRRETPSRGNDVDLGLIKGSIAKRGFGLGAAGHGLVGVVAVLSARASQGPCAMTISSLTPVSFEPPLVLAAVAESSRMRAVLEVVGGFGISVLAADQEATARHFASRRRPTGADQFTGVAIRPGPVTGSPLLEGAVGWFDCLTYRIAPAGDHSLVIGEVGYEASTRSLDATPLLHGHGGYHRLRTP